MFVLRIMMLTIDAWLRLGMSLAGDSGGECAADACAAAVQRLKYARRRGKCAPMFSQPAPATMRCLTKLAIFLCLTGRLLASPTGPTLQFDYGHGQCSTIH